MYDLDGVVPGDDVTTVDPGTNLLITGDTQAAHELLLDVLAPGPGAGETAIVVSTNEPADSVLGGLDTRDALDPDRIGVVDCTTGDHDRATTDVPVAYLSSPADLTGISLEFAKIVERLQPAELRVGFSSVSTLLMYAEVETVFRFLHVFCSRVRTGGWFGAFALDPEMHERETVNTVRALFDGEVGVRGDGIEVRGVG